MKICNTLEEYKKERERGEEVYFYHGSPVKDLSYLLPRPTKVVDGEEYVFATPCFWMAAIFSIKIKNFDKHFDLGFYQDLKTKEKTGFIRELERGNLQRFFSKQSGWVYYVNPLKFQNDARLGMQNHEFICNERVEVLHTQYIKNVYKILKNSDALLIYF
jgi:hypothetical protein